MTKQKPGPQIHIQPSSITKRGLQSWPVGCLLFVALTASAQTTAFTYQGRLDDGGYPASGLYDLRFTLHGEVVLPGFQVGLPRTHSGVAVSNGG